MEDRVLATTHPMTQLQALDKRLNEMKDWKSFSVAPKRTELIEAIRTNDDPLGGEPLKRMSSSANRRSETASVSSRAGK